MSRSVVLGLVLVMALAILAAWPPAAAAPIETIWVQIVDQTGTPLANEKIIIAVWNETGNEAIAYFKGTTNGTGYATLTLLKSLDDATPYSGTLYNFTIAINRYGRWLLLEQSTGIDWSTLSATLFNQTVTATHWWSLNFSAWTGPGFNLPLYFKDGPTEEIPIFRVYWNDTGELITEIAGGAGAGNVASELFNISDTQLTITEVATGKFLVTGKPVVLLKETYWRMLLTPGGYTPVLVGKETLDFSTSGEVDVEDKIVPANSIGAVTLDPITDIEDHAYTVFYIVNILDPCGTQITLGDLSSMKVFLQTKLNGKTVILRSAAPSAGVAPARGFYYEDFGRDVFWIPDVTRLFGVNATLSITYYNIQVFSASFNTTIDVQDKSDIGPIFSMNVDPTTGVRTVDAFTSIVRTRIVIKDSQPIAQPLVGAKVILSYGGGDPIYTATGAGGAVHLPPFTASGAGEGQGSVVNFVGAYFPDGYLPVPFSFRTTGTLFSYRITVLWKLPGGDEWIDVTPANNLVSLNLTDYILSCTTQEFEFRAKVYHMLVTAIDLCGEPLSSATYPGATLIMFMDDKPIGAIGLGVDGTMSFGYVPAGSFKFRLLWKGIKMRANVTAPTEPVIQVTGNVAAVLQFPVGNLNITATLWDVNVPVEGLEVTIEYYANGTKVYAEPTKITDAAGTVTYTQVPLVPLAGTYDIRVIMKTTTATPNIRVPGDVGLKVADYSILSSKLKLECWNIVTVPTWIYSFRLWALDHKGDVLTQYETASNGTIPTVAILLDNDPRFQIVNMTGALVEGSPLNVTRNGISEAKFTFLSREPHFFVAGANYTFMVFHGGVMVYNYTITLPKPTETLTVFFNESSGESWTRTGVMYNYTWSEDVTVHPIMTFTGAPSWLDGGAQADSLLRLVTWTQTLTIHTLSSLGHYVVPNLKIALFRSDVINWTPITHVNATPSDVYGNLTDTAMWDLTGYVITATDGNGDGAITFQIPVWKPGTPSTPSFGARIEEVYVLAGKDWGTPGVPDTPKEAATITLDPGTGATFTLSGYVVNWNHTESIVTVDPTEFYPDWYKDGKLVTGKDWNMTFWSGASKVVRTIVMEGVCVEVKAPDITGKLVGVPNQYVNLTAVGDTGAKLLLGTGLTDETGIAKFAPGTAGKATLPDGTELPIIAGPVTYMFDVEGAIGPAIEYNIKTWQNFEDVLKPYGLTPSQVLDLDVLETTITFSEDYNAYKECVQLEWGAIIVTIEDWSGKPLRNAMVAAIMYTPTPKAKPSTFAFTGSDGLAILLVPPDIDSRYELKVFWRDSYLLFKAGAIPSFIDIYSSYADEITPRFYGYASDAVRTGTIKTYVYVGLIQLLTKDGKPLSPAALSKITVAITWPDKTVTKVKPGSDGVAPVILNSETVDKWPVAASAKYNPNSPHPQSPPGEYSVVVTWSGIPTPVAEKTFRIHRAKLETPEVRETVYVDVTDVTVTLTTPFNTPLAGAAATITMPDGTTMSVSTDNAGRISIAEVPTGRIDLKVTSWKGFTLQFQKTGVTTGSVTVDNIGKLVVTVVGARGQGLAGAKVTISGAGGEVVTSTDASGKAEMEVPTGTYNIRVEKGGKTATLTATVQPGPAVTEAPPASLDIFMSLAGWDMSFSDYVGMILLIVVLVIVLFIIAHEYSVWRRRRIARAIVPARPSE